MSPRANASRRAFTLLEVLLATMIIAFLGLTLHRFLTTNLRAMQYSNDLRDDQAAVEAAVEIVREQLRTLPALEANALEGRTQKFRGLPSDEITWLSAAGPGLLTTAAAGRYRVTLAVQPVSERSTETELGLRRQPLDSASGDAPNLNRGGQMNRYDWVPLVRPMAALEIRYYDGQSRQWQDAWLQSNTRPSMVQVRLWRQPQDPPFEAILPVPSARTAQ